MAQRHQENTFELDICAYLAKHGWAIESQAKEKDGYARCNNYDQDKAFIPQKVLAFVKKTQPEAWRRYHDNYNGDSDSQFIKHLASEISKHGLLKVMRSGFKDYSGASFDLCYFKPNNDLNADNMAKYKQNILTVVRQLHYSITSEKSIDLVFFINGLPLATMELKTDFTQNITDAIKQYKNDRKPVNEIGQRETLLTFKMGALVHFAVSSDEVFMTTHLNGEKTFFLPFNKGNGDGAGNPPNPKGYKTAYIWEDLFDKDNILDILNRFMHLEKKEVETKGKTSVKETMIFPRYHQWKAVKVVEDAVKAEGVGKKYLIQHSAGSGKSNTIAWLSYRLHSLSNEQDETFFDQVFVITDRRVLDKQLQDTITQFDHKKGVVQQIDKNSAQLASAINNRTPIVITTLQKFPFVLDKVKKLNDRKFAVIIDEAHSSQSGSESATMKKLLGDETSEDEINEIIKSNKSPKNISFFAFTATPKNKTLEIFGRKGKEDDAPRAFHVYTMKQAIEEGFIMNVLKNYTTYKTVFQIAKKAECHIKEDIDKIEGAKALSRFLKLHPTQISQKVVIIVEHFRTCVAPKINGKAKAMVVCDSREGAVRYCKEFRKYIAERGYSDIDALVAFSGKIKDPDVATKEWTETSLNKGLNHRSIPDAFASEDFQVLIVANKFQTGFDQPLLHTMYVDKKLSGVMAVQTLSRLNRICENKKDTFILDFVNKAEDIEEAFAPYYKETLLDGETDPNLIFEQKAKLDEYDVYEESEIDAFYKEFNRKVKNNQGALHKLVDPAVDRFKALKKDKQGEFKGGLQKLLRFYEFVTQIVAFDAFEIEKFYYFGKLLNKKLPNEHHQPINLQDDVMLTYLKVEKQHEKEIALEKETKLAPLTAVGTGASREEERVPLEELISKLNELWASEVTDGDKISFVQTIGNKMLENEELRQDAKNNSKNNFKWGSYGKAFDSSVISAIDTQRDMAMEILEDKSKMALLKETMMTLIYDALRKDIKNMGEHRNG